MYIFRRCKSKADCEDALTSQEEMWCGRLVALTGTYSYRLVVYIDIMHIIHIIHTLVINRYPLMNVSTQVWADECRTH